MGPTLSKFFTALRDRQIVGTRGSDGKIHVPAAEYDPVTYAPLTDVVPVSSVGTVQSWSWQPEPLEGQPLAKPFAWALIKLDGADTSLLHAVDVGAAGSAGITTGARVHAVWADETVGAITDIAYFALGEKTAAARPPPRIRSQSPCRSRRSAWRFSTSPPLRKALTYEHFPRESCSAAAPAPAGACTSRHAGGPADRRTHLGSGAGGG
ncbi:hypothetical protein I540_4991 [Mycobacteroides abscessus subsp. bolletii 1513]|uniref:ChsH2 C-terminal OB-fold domain-containing protein n=1 Tax=Mycobacteroides abscessus subsp. bolletii 1513 TaxID=1299321 RepID=X8DHC1_9MYCO|nr:hypothetical protein I540_4991 [Mycobacteroides abscessus subsp. bolletii 1513]